MRVCVWMCVYVVYTDFFFRECASRGSMAPFVCGFVCGYLFVVICLWLFLCASICVFVDTYI